MFTFAFVKKKFANFGSFVCLLEKVTELHTLQNRTSPAKTYGKSSVGDWEYGIGLVLEGRRGPPATPFWFGVMLCMGFPQIRLDRLGHGV